MRAVLLLAACGVAGAQSLPADRVITSDAVVESLRFSADGTTLVGNCEDGRIRHWDALTGKLKRAVSFEKESRPSALSDSGDLLMAVGRDGSVHTWDTNTGGQMPGLITPARSVQRLILSPDGKLAAGASRAHQDGSEYTVRIWDVSGGERHALPAGIGGISTMAFSPDGQILVAGGYDTDLRAWRTRDGELLRLMNELPLSMFAAAFSPDGKHLATAGADGIVYLWDTKTWKISRRLTGQPEMISALAFSPDSRLLLTGGSGELNKNAVQVMLWDLSSGKAIRSMPSAHIVRAAAFAPDSTRVATATYDQKVSIWGVPAASGH